MTTNDFRSHKPAGLDPRAAYPAASRHIPDAYQEQLFPVVSLKAPDSLPSPEVHANPEGHQLGATPIDRIKRLPLTHQTGKFSYYFRMLACINIIGGGATAIFSTGEAERFKELVKDEPHRIHHAKAVLEEETGKKPL